MLKKDAPVFVRMCGKYQINLRRWCNGLQFWVIVEEVVIKKFFFYSPSLTARQLRRGTDRKPIIVCLINSNPKFWILLLIFKLYVVHSIQLSLFTHRNNRNTCRYVKLNLEHGNYLFSWNYSQDWLWVERWDFQY